MAISVQENARTSRKGVVQMGRGRGPGYYDEGGVWVSTARLERAVRQMENRQSRGRRGGWTPRTVGSTEDGTEVTFRQGTGDNEGHTLISDGDKSARQFDARHNHYGPNREDDGYVDGNRGHYTGPGS